MAGEAFLVGSSEETRAWLGRLREDLSDLDYHERDYWAVFRSKDGTKRVADLNPSKKKIRLFLPFHPNYASDLKPSPSSKSYQKRSPSVFDIKSEADLSRAAELIRLAYDVAGTSTRKKRQSRPIELASEELPSGIQYFEGAARHVVVNAYERNAKARKACIRHYGSRCVVCEFDFQEKYGEAAAGFIHVHHVVPIAQVGVEYQLDPVRDLRPVCPNCHAVIHRREPPYSMDEVQAMLLRGPSFVEEQRSRT